MKQSDVEIAEIVDWPILRKVPGQDQINDVGSQLTEGVVVAIAPPATVDRISHLCQRLMRNGGLMNCFVPASSCEELIIEQQTTGQQ